jgi:hypothetical protein
VAVVVVAVAVAVAAEVVEGVEVVEAAVVELA